MLVYPQLSTGALTQFPVQKRRRLRTVTNRLAEERSILLADPGAEVTEWQLQYEGLSDSEALSLQQFFEATEGRLLGFTFLDPTANLFAWSDQLDHAGWSHEPFLSLTSGVTDPTGGMRGWRLENGGAAGQRISQTLAAPGAYVYCLSAYLRSAVATTVTLLRGCDRVNRVVGTDWSRMTFSGPGSAGAGSVEFGIEVPAGASVELFGLQLEPQAGASRYKSSTTGGIYTDARFRDDELSLTATDVNRHSATVNIIHANRL